MANIARQMNRQEKRARRNDNLHSVIYTGEGNFHMRSNGIEFKPYIEVALKKRAEEARERIRQRKLERQKMFPSDDIDLSSNINFKKKGIGNLKLKALVKKNKQNLLERNWEGGGIEAKNNDDDVGLIELPKNPSMKERFNNFKEQIKEFKESKNKLSYLIIYPEQQSKLYWDLLVGFCVVYTTLSVPYRLGFGVKAEGSTYVFEMSINFFFLVDIVVTFFTAYRAKSGELITSHWLIAKQYIRGMFFVDLVASIPYDLLVNEEDGDGSLAGMKFLRVIRLVKLIRLFRLKKLKSLLSNSEQHMLVDANTLTLLKVLLVLVLMAHFMGCIWNGTGFLSDTYPNLNTWKSGIPASLYDMGSLYLVNIYFAFTCVTTVGYGEISPVSHLERVVVIFFEILGSVIFGYVVGNITGVIQNMNPKNTLYKEKMTYAKAYIRSRNYPRDLAIRLRYQFDYYYESVSNFENSKLLEATPEPMQIQLSFVQYDKIIRSIPFLHLQGASFSNALVPKLKPLLLLPGEVLTVQNEIGMAFYFVEGGELASYLTLQPNANDPPIIVPYLKLSAGSFVGEMAVMLDTPTPFTVISKRMTKLYFVTKEDLMNTLRYFPSVKDDLRNIAVVNIQNYDKYRREKELEIFGMTNIKSQSISSFKRGQGLDFTTLGKGGKNLMATKELLGQETRKQNDAANTEEEESKTVDLKKLYGKDTIDKGVERLFRKFHKEDEEDSVFDARLITDPVYLWQKKKILHPEVRALYVWEIFCYSIIFYNVMTLSLREGFQLEPSGFYLILDNIICAIFFIDMAVNFNVAYWSKLEKQFVTDRRRISLNYVKSWFFIDFISTVPFHLFNFAANTNSSILRVFRLIKLFRLSRFSKLFKKLELYEDDIIIFNPNTLKSAKIGITLLFVAHIDACLWYYVGSMNSNSWITNYCPDPSDVCLIDKPLNIRYLTSMYWAITTMMTVGYGDIYPTQPNMGEIIVAILTQVVGAIVISYLIGVMLHIIVNFNLEERRDKQQSVQLMEFLVALDKRNTASHTKRFLTGIVNQSNHSKTIKSVFNEEELSQILPPFLLACCIKFTHYKIIARLPLICEMESKFPNFLTLICPMLKPAKYREGEVLVDPILFTREVFFVISGAIALTKNFDKSKKYSMIPAYTGRKASFGRRTSGKVMVDSMDSDNINKTNQTEERVVVGPGKMFGVCFVLAPDNVKLDASVEIRAYANSTIMYLSYNDFQQLNIHYPSMMQYWTEQMVTYIEEELTMISWDQKEDSTIEAESPLLYECYQKVKSGKSSYDQSSQEEYTDIPAEDILQSGFQESQEQLIKANDDNSALV